MVANIEKKLPISAIVVGYNEAHLLMISLPKLNFCDEIIYFDLGSTDESEKIAVENNATIIHHKKVPICEWIHAEHYKKTKHNWVLIIDPDELISDSLKDQIKYLYTHKHDQLENAGCISVPWVFYFKQKKLLGTIWGGVKTKVILIHNQKFEFTPLVHLGRKLREDYSEIKIPFDGQNAIQHYWMTSYKKLFEKHKRYLKNEGEARYLNGQKTSLKEIILSPFKSFRTCYILTKGYRDGATGLFLSLFWAWYQTSALIQLYEFNLKKSEKY